MAGVDGHRPGTGGCAGGEGGRSETQTHCRHGVADGDDLPEVGVILHRPPVDTLMCLWNCPVCSLQPGMTTDLSYHLPLTADLRPCPRSA